MNFVERKISTKQAISILSRKGIDVNETEADIILDFLYLVARNYDKKAAVKNDSIPNKKSNSR